MRRSIIIALTGLGLLVATPASAQPDTVRIPVTAADLETRESVAQLYQRVNVAAASVCQEIMAGQISVYRTRRQCRVDLIDHALENTRHASLADYHAEMRSRPVSTTLAAR